MRHLNKLPFILLLLFAVSCKPFSYGYSHNKANNQYNLITGNKKNLGDKRIKYTKSLYKKSELGNFLNCACNERGLPDFIYEYEKSDKCRGIKLFYLQQDSVFVFEEPKKNRFSSVLQASRKMTDNEKLIFKQLQSGLTVGEKYATP